MIPPVKLAAWVLLLAAVSGCTPSQPPRWSEGGAPLMLPEARWQRDGDDTIEIKANGHVVEDGDLIFVIDRVGQESNATFQDAGIEYYRYVQ